jgi:hypothetical protein
MNAYKLDWYLATQAVSAYHFQRLVAASDEFHKQRGVQKSPGNLVAELAVKQAVETAIFSIGLKAMKHLSQSQLKNRLGVVARISGRAGLRVIPVVGTAMMVYDAYQVFDYFFDD